MIGLFGFFYVFRELHMKLNSERKTKEKLEDKVVHSTESQSEYNIEFNPVLWHSSP